MIRRIRIAARIEENSGFSIRSKTAGSVEKLFMLTVLIFSLPDSSLSVAEITQKSAWPHTYS
jgi:hypothetical protein